MKKISLVSVCAIFCFSIFVSNLVAQSLAPFYKEQLNIDKGYEDYYFSIYPDSIHMSGELTITFTGENLAFWQNSETCVYNSLTDIFGGNISTTNVVIFNDDISIHPGTVYNFLNPQSIFEADFVFPPDVQHGVYHIIVGNGECEKIIANAFSVINNCLAEFSYQIDGSMIFLQKTYSHDESNYSILWDFGDGNTILGSDSINYIYENDGNYTITCTVEDIINGYCSDNFSQTIEILTVDVNKIQLSEIQISPNPSNGIFFLKGENINSVKIINPIGQHIFSVSDYRNETLNISNQPKGLYFIIIQQENRIITKSVILE